MIHFWEIDVIRFEWEFLFEMHFYLFFLIFELVILVCFSSFFLLSLSSSSLSSSSLSLLLSLLSSLFSLLLRPLFLSIQSPFLILFFFSLSFFFLFVGSNFKKRKIVSNLPIGFRKGCVCIGLKVCFFIYLFIISFFCFFVLLFFLFFFFFFSFFYSMYFFLIKKSKNRFMTLGCVFIIVIYPLIRVKRYLFLFLSLFFLSLFSLPLSFLSLFLFSSSLNHVKKNSM